MAREKKGLYFKAFCGRSGDLKFLNPKIMKSQQIKTKKTGRGSSPKQEEKLEQALLEVRRVTRVVAGGKRFRFRVIVAIGDKNGKVGVGIAKGADVTTAVEKAKKIARNNLITATIIDGTIPHEIRLKYGSAKILLRPAKRGRGIIAGGVLRTICSLAGIENITAKILGSSNKLNNARATLLALSSFRNRELKTFESDHAIT